jgi:gluconate 2-dehydrogenase gamma chain
MDCSGEEKAPSRLLSRGELLKRAGVVGAAAAVPAALAPDPALAQEELAQLQQMKALSPGEAATIGAVCDRLIPSDSTGPGAREANVIRYIDRALAGDLAMFRSSYTAAAVALDAYSQSKYGGGFAALSTTQQDAVLTDMDLNRATGFSPNAKAVFEMIRTHAVQGMFGDPAHGGNTNFVGWKLVRFPGPRLVISARDQRLDVVPRSNLKSTYSNPLFRARASRRD